MDTEKGYTGPLNIGNPEEYTISELADLILELTGSKSELVYKNLAKDDPVDRQPDISQAKNLLSWEPRTPLKEGLLKTIEYFESILN